MKHINQNRTEEQRRKKRDYMRGYQRRRRRDDKFVRFSERVRARYGMRVDVGDLVAIERALESRSSAMLTVGAFSVECLTALRMLRKSLGWHGGKAAAQHAARLLRDLRQAGLVGVPTDWRLNRRYTALIVFWLRKAGVEIICERRYVLRRMAMSQKEDQ